MSTTYLLAANGQTLDQFFDPYVTGTSPPATDLLNDQGVDIASNIYAPISFGSMATTATDLLTQQAGNADIRTLFAAKGTAVYLIATPNYNGQLIETTSTGTVSARITINPDGTWTSSTVGQQGYWYGGVSPTPGIGSSYQLLATVGSHGGTVTNPASSYTTISSALTITLTSNGTTSCTLQLQIRAVGAGSPGSNGNLSLAVTVDG